MAKSVNKVILVGNVGQDPELKYTASGVPVAKLSRAADHSPRTTRNFLERRLWTTGARLHTSRYCRKPLSRHIRPHRPGDSRQVRVNPELTH
jgi:Single-strand binding protein family